MPKSSFVDFRAVKAAITMEQVLEHYGILDRFKRSGDSLSGPCPIHKGSNSTQFRVSTTKNIWNCFSECKHGGNTLDFIARMENISIHAAALKAIEWFHLDPAEMSAAEPGEEHAGESAPDETEAKPKPVAKKPAPAVEKGVPNAPLKFRLDKLEREHPYLIKERGLTLETIVDFGIGFCAKGMMANRIAIPIHNPEGLVVAYAGRWPGEPSEGTPRVISHELEDYPSFNCWHDAKLFDFLLQREGVHSGLNPDGNGIVEMPVKRLVESLDSKELKLSPDLRDAIKEDIEWADDNLHDHISYECF